MSAAEELAALDRGLVDVGMTAAEAIALAKELAVRVAALEAGLAAARPTPGFPGPSRLPGHVT
jgi:hypothetical protein